jgi:manganese/iron transport system substrate-binding protein
VLSVTGPRTPSSMAHNAYEKEMRLLRQKRAVAATLWMAVAALQAQLIEASAGLTSRTARGEEEAVLSEADPHFWLDPTLVVKYAQNIRDGLIKADPSHAASYTANTAAYIDSLNELDVWIKQQVAEIPAARRLLVTDHESFGYFADRYGFQVAGAIVPSVSTDASPSARQFARLVDTIKQTGVRAIFLESGSSSQLADQVAAETGVKVVTGLYSHSLTDVDGPAPTYLDMMRFNTLAIVEALK